ncbi:FMN-dependent NADH-azoreductase [Paenibacillus sp. YN15]|uniref:FMN-dependent NADH-azoreductase n=1 Tax=Paenibacillus sp. YN15 TaxID=1742774 RepID=UPI000DCDA51A|nr:FMN-dependent NADH-azoreductase [Paenibacillus sp. YN15]RAU96175.1 FMN-dependent NADH-azoreductase [Paenibacillus sp. YN15]
MSSVLFIKANPRPAEQAVSVQLYDAFLKSYRAAQPGDEIVELDLFKNPPPYYDAVHMTAMYKLANGYGLTQEETEAAAQVNGYLDQFLAADKVVIAFPLWNFSAPAQLVSYLHFLSQAGKTFKYTAEGPVGLAGNKKVVLLNARGGVYSVEPMQALEMSLSYVRNVLAFWGIKDIETVVVEGHNQFPDRSQAIVQEGIGQAVELAARF